MKNKNVLGLAALPATTLFASQTARGASIEQFTPYYGSDNAILDMSVTNNDSGAVYDSGGVSLFETLGTDLYALPGNQSTYSSMEDMIGDWHISIRGAPTGEVYNGWRANISSTGQVGLTHIGGIPGLSFDRWLDTWTNRNIDTMALTLSIPNSQLELDGVLGYNPATDAQIVIGVDANPNAFVGNTGTPAPGQNYHVVPEATTSALLMAGAITALAGRKTREVLGKVRQCLAKRRHVGRANGDAASCPE